MKLSTESLVSLWKYCLFDESVYTIIGFLNDIFVFNELVYDIIGFLNDILFCVIKLLMKPLVSLRTYLFYDGILKI